MKVYLLVSSLPLQIHFLRRNSSQSLCSHNWKFSFCVFENHYQLMCISDSENKKRAHESIFTVVKKEPVCSLRMRLIKKFLCLHSHPCPPRVSSRGDIINFQFEHSRRIQQILMMPEPAPYGEKAVVQNADLPDFGHECSYPIWPKRRHRTDFKLQTALESCKLAEGQGLGPGHSLSPECERDPG